MSSTRGQSWPGDKNVSEMLGMTMKYVSATDEEVRFETTDGRTFLLNHLQDCCESVTVESIDGDLDTLIGEPLVQAEEVLNPEPPVREPKEYPAESETWTFYKFATIKGHVTIRFYGTSNGYYSESVYFSEV